MFSFRDSSLATADRVADLLARMTLAEKVGQCMQLDAQGDLDDLVTLLFGDIGPSGRLPISLPVHAGQQPTYDNQVRGQHGNRYADLTQEPAFRLDPGAVGTDGTIRATVTVANTGAPHATETVQWYVRDLVTSVTWADKELQGFEKVAVGSGESVDVTRDLEVSARTLVDADGTRVVEPGDVEVLVGPDSRNTSLLYARFAAVA